MSLARRHLERCQAESAAALSGAVAAAPLRLTPASPPAAAARPTLATRHRERSLGSAVAQVMAEAANDNAEPAGPPAPSPYLEMQFRLAGDRRTLKAIQSVEKKIERKRELLPAYLPWIEGVLAQARETGAAADDEILATVMIWSIDIGDYDLALILADHVLKHRLSLPERFNRQPAVLIVEEISDAALLAFGASKPWPHGVLETAEQLTAGFDMPDQVSAKLQKAIGLEQQHLADNPPADHAIAGWRSAHLDRALTCFRRALELNPKAGVKKPIEQLERELKKTTAEDAESST